MIVDDLHVEGIGSAPNEAHAPLVVDPNAVLARPATLEPLETVARRNAKILKRTRSVQNQEFSAGDSLEGAKARYVPVVKEILGCLRPKRSITRRIIPVNGKRYNDGAVA